MFFQMDSSPGGVTLRPRLIQWTTSSMDEKMAWLPPWQHVLLVKFSRGQVCLDNLKLMDKKPSLQQTPTWGIFFYCGYTILLTTSTIASNYLVLTWNSWPTITLLHRRLRATSHHGPRAVTMELWEYKRKCQKAVPRHFQTHIVWSQTLKCSVKSYVTRASTVCYFNEILFMRILIHDKKSISTIMSVQSAMVSRFCVRPTSKRWFLIIGQMTMKHDLFDAM